MAPPSPPQQPASSLTAAQTRSLRAVVDALLPPLPVPAIDSNEAIKRYWEYRLSHDPAFMAALDDSIRKLSEGDRFLTKSLLGLLSTNIGTSLLFGTLALHAFPEWPVPERSELLRVLQLSAWPTRKRIFHALKRQICSLAYSFTVAGKNPFWEAMGYPGAPQHQAVSAKEDTNLTFYAMEQQMDLQQSMLTVENTTTLDCDVLIIGSGAGGCVAASVLSRAGYKVLVVEKGSYLSPAEVTNLEADAWDRLYESHGRLTTTDGSIMIFAGSTLGGGTTVNWNACLPLPEHVREEWVKSFGLQAFGEAGDYDRALKYVMKRIVGVDKFKTTIVHTAMNRKLMEGCEAMGYKWLMVAQALKNKNADPVAGYLAFGDRYGNKNSAVSVFLKDAVQHGAQILTQARVDRVLKTSTAKLSRGERSRAIGAECKVTSRYGEKTKLTIFAKRSVVVTAGALHTPCLLQKSGLSNQHIGRHLRLHPTTSVLGFMKEQDDIDCFLGAPVTAVCNEFEFGPVGDGYGALIESACAHPGFTASCLVWTTPLQFKDRLRRLRHMVPYLVLQRDSGEGTVRLANDGSLQIDYSVNKGDKESMANAVTGALKILMTTGATEITASGMRDPGLKLFSGPYSVLRMASDVVVQSYLSSVYRQGMDKHEIALFSAHQMGSCRMSTSPAFGALDINGETWECDNLYVMDASTFPSASGVNPMITVLAIAKMLSSRLAMRLRHEDRRTSSEAEAQRAEQLIAERKELRKIEEESNGLSNFTENWLPHLVLWLILIFMFVPIVTGEIMGRVAALKAAAESAGAAAASAAAAAATKAPSGGGIAVDIPGATSEVNAPWEGTNEGLPRFFEPNSLIWSVLFIPLLFAAR